MSLYFEKARELGRLVLESEYSLRFSDADAALKANAQAQAKIEEYKKYQAMINENMRKGAVTDAELPQVNARLEEMAAELKQEPAVNDYISAENAYNQFVGQIMSVFKATLSSSSDLEDCPGCGVVRHCSGCH